VIRSRASCFCKTLHLNTPELLHRCYIQTILLNRCKYLLEIKHAAGLSPYLRLDPKPLTIHRARLRLDRAKLNGSLADRCLVDSDRCPHCPSKRESPDHLLLICPRYRPARQKLSSLLRKHDLKLSLSLLLGEYPSKVRQNKEVLKALRRFILSVHSDRGF
jgi:hypothetical protein